MCVCITESLCFTLEVNTKVYLNYGASQVVPVVRSLPAKVGDIRDVGLIPGSGRSLGEGNGYPIQYSCLGNPMDRGAWGATVHRVAKSQTWLKILSVHTRALNIVPGATCRTVMLIHAECSSLYSPTPNSWSIPLSPAPGLHKSFAFYKGWWTVDLVTTHLPELQKVSSTGVETCVVPCWVPSTLKSVWLWGTLCRHLLNEWMKGHYPNV